MTIELGSFSDSGALVVTVRDAQADGWITTGASSAGIEVFASAGSSAEVRCVILAPDPVAFCADAENRRIRALQRLGPDEQEEALAALHNWVEAIRTSPKPVIAAAEGGVAGAGLALMLACDLMVAARNARFMASTRDAAMPPDAAIAWLLPRAVPRQLASEWLLGGGEVTAARLHALGVVNRLSESQQALASALACAGEITARTPRALQCAKSLIASGQRASLAEYLPLERERILRSLRAAGPAPAA